MRSVNHPAARIVRSTVCGVALAAMAGPALAGGPLYLTRTQTGLEPIRWEGPVQVYTDLGGLGSIGNAKANELVRKSLKEWSSVPTSSFRAAIAGDFADLGLGDITGANAGHVIGADNGGGIHVIYDSDGSVIADFIGAGYGVLGIATPEFLASEGSTEIVEGWMIVTGQPDWLEDTTGGPVAGVITHEFGHAINLAHTQTNGLYFRNQPIEAWGIPAGPEQAGPDQCGQVVPVYPSAGQLETMYPFIDPYPSSPMYNSAEMATVNVADDHAALSALYPAAGYRQQSGTLRGRVVAKDGSSELTGINVIARNAADRFDAISRISGDRTQGQLGPDGSFEITGLTPGTGYVVYVDEIGAGGFSTPKAILLGPEEYWNAGESRDATLDDACVATPVTLAAGETREIQIAINGIDRAPTFTHIPYSLATDVSDNGQRIAGKYAAAMSPFWVWDKTRGMTFIDGFGSSVAISGNGRTIGGSFGVEIEEDWGSYLQERAALWTRESGWKVIAGATLQGCGMFHTSVFDLSNDGSTAVGLAWGSCSDVFAFKWNAKGGLKRLHKVSDGAARANAVSAPMAGWSAAGKNFPRQGVSGSGPSGKATSRRS